MLSRTSTLLLLCLFVLNACSGVERHVANDGSQAAKEYYQNLKRWQSLGWENYDVVYQRQCFCVAAVTKKIRVKVRGGRINDAVYAEDNGTLVSDINHGLKSIDDWFKLISNAIDRPADSLQVSYDEALGYPRSLSIDYYQRMADDEVSVKIFDVIQK